MGKAGKIIAIMLIVVIAIVAVSVSNSSTKDDFEENLEKGLLPYERGNEIVWLNYTEYLRKRGVIPDYDEVVITDRHVQVTHYSSRETIAFLGGGMENMLRESGISESRIGGMGIDSDLYFNALATTAYNIFVPAFDDMNMTSAEIRVVAVDLLYADSNGNAIGDKKYCDQSGVLNRQKYCEEVYPYSWYDKEYVEKCDIHRVVNWKGEKVPDCKEKPFNLESFLSITASRDDLAKIVSYGKFCWDCLVEYADVKIST
jgi:hypothetical protein